MSYDLFFTSESISRESFKRYFNGRPYYQIEKDQAWYTNEDSGVYFSFEVNDDCEEDEDLPHSASFNMNYFRPHFFAIEAEPEVRAFIDHFSCSIDDPQNEGMESGPYSGEGFLRGWYNGNEFSMQAILNMPENTNEYVSKPTVELEKHWKWNKSRMQRDEDLREDIFIPKIMYGNIDGEFASFCVWPDGIPTLIPKVDFLHIPRQELAPKKGLFRKKEEDFCLVRFSEAYPILSQYSVADFELEAFKLPVTEIPKAIKQFVTGLSKFEGQVEGIGSDLVLNQELIEKYKK